MAEKLKFLFVPAPGIGHFNPCIAIGEELKSRGHSVTFVTPGTYAGTLTRLGFSEELYEFLPRRNGFTFGERIAKASAAFAAASPPAILKDFLFPTLEHTLYAMESSQGRFQEIMVQVHPDVVIVDNLLDNPYFQGQGVPWVRLISWNPIGISRLNVPPPACGLPTAGPRALWNELELELDSIYGDFLQQPGHESLRKVCDPCPHFYPLPITLSPYANIYNFPLELDYTPLRPTPPKFHQVDSLIKDGGTQFEIPAEIRDGQGKLIYFSMGTIGCGDVELMKRLVAILTQSPHRFIVSKGQLGDWFDLGPNMWGAKDVPQTRVIPLVDLVITHGGNNTLTESFYHGKRVLVLPMYCDQLDNGQRVTETGLGLHFHPYKVTQAELLEGIEQVLNDELLERRMKSIGQRIRAARNDQGKAADVIIRVAQAQSQIEQNP